MNAARRFPNAPLSVSRARAFVVAALEGYPRELIDKAELMVSELATNALRHAHKGFTVEVGTDPAQVRVEVTDAGGGSPRRRFPTLLEPTGRGLQIVAALADRWDVTPVDTGGKTVWFILSLAS
jgi:anti-sigma regulatory factor (Ser/Thr protein kinase)